MTGGGDHFIGFQNHRNEHGYVDECQKQEAEHLHMDGHASAMQHTVDRAHHHAYVQRHDDERDANARKVLEPMPFEDFLFFKDKLSFRCRFHRVSKFSTS